MSSARRVLGEVGIGAEAEDVYQYLLGNPGASLQEIRRGTGLPRHRVEAAVDELTAGALISRRGGATTEFQAAPPDVVVEALVSARLDRLHQTRLATQYLQSLQRVSGERTHANELIEILTTAESCGERWAQLQIASSQTLEAFIRPPFLSNPEDNEAHQSRLLERGVVIRGIYDQAALEWPGTLEHIRRMIALGEKVRIVDSLPIKLTLFDRKAALVPIADPESLGSADSGLVVHPCNLLDALSALFDLCWERGTELHDLDGTSPTGPSREEEVLALMAVGWKDEAIASKLGVSAQTVRRHISAVQQRLGVTTRFQIGLALGRKARQ